MSLVLVTGGTGHLGRDIVTRLVRDGHRVRVFARAPRPEMRVEWAIGDLATGEGLRAAAQDVQTIDLLRGDEAYKHLWHSEKVPTYGCARSCNRAGAAVDRAFWENYDFTLAAP